MKRLYAHGVTLIEVILVLLFFIGFWVFLNSSKWLQSFTLRIYRSTANAESRHIFLSLESLLSSGITVTDIDDTRITFQKNAVSHTLFVDSAAASDGNYVLQLVKPSEAPIIISTHIAADPNTTTPSFTFKRIHPSRVIVVDYDLSYRKNRFHYHHSIVIETNNVSL